MKAESIVTVTPSATVNIPAATAGARVEDAPRVAPSAPVQTQQRKSGPEPTDKSKPAPTQKKTDDTLESVKPIKKKKARRE